MKIDPAVLEAIKNMDLPKLIRGYGIELKPTGKNAYQIRCPFHEDKTRACPSDTETINGCGTVSGAVPMVIRWIFALPTRRSLSVRLIRKGRRSYVWYSTGTNGDGATVRP
jgi:hypothetical protein